jgi:hypothetical protein
MAYYDDQYGDIFATQHGYKLMQTLANLGICDEHIVLELVSFHHIANGDCVASFEQEISYHPMRPPHFTDAEIEP